MKQYDAIVIGSGQAGTSMANQLLKAGQKVAIAEGYRFGGSCVNYGCRPTKTLIASARVAHLSRRGADFGVNIDHLTINWDRVRERVTGIIENTSGGIEKWLRGLERLDVYHAYANFEGKANGQYRVRMGAIQLSQPRESSSIPAHAPSSHKSKGLTR
jgi:pyruvate/2-oxoglutarate dehydrogenase complex dihydrolipoamide dehydrogenase (E3) component